MVTYQRVAKEWMSMNHEVADGPITIVRVVNPCLYWIRCSHCFSISEIEKVLQHSILTQATDVKRGDRVVLRNFDNHLYRAVVQGPAPVKCGKKELLRYKVFVIDSIDILTVQPEQLYRVRLRSYLDDVSQQLHLVGIESGRPVLHLESGNHLEEGAHYESQRRQVFTILKSVKSVEFKTKRKFESVTFGKCKLYGEECQNLLRVLIKENLAQYRENFINALVLSGWLEKVEEELNRNKELLSPPPLVESSKEDFSKILPPPPPVVFDENKIVDLENLTRAPFGVENLLDRIVPNPIVETFEEMNNRYRKISKYEATRRKKAPIHQELKFEYTSDSHSLVGGLVPVEIDCDTKRKLQPPTSSEEDYNSSHEDSALSIQLSSHESDAVNGDISSESDVSYANGPLKTDRFQSFESNPKLNSEGISSETRPLCSIDTIPANKICVGRGKMFQKYIPASRQLKHTLEESTPKNNPAMCQLDDANCEGYQGPCRFSSFVPDTDSVVDFLDGFLDETCDSMDEYYGDFTRMNKPQNSVPSPEGIRPVQSSPSACSTHPPPAPLDNIQAGELSAEESVLSLSRSSSAKSVSIPDMLPINKRRAAREQKLQIDCDSSDGSTSEKSFNARKVVSGIGRGKLFQQNFNISSSPATIQQPLDENKIDNGLPHRTKSIMGRGKLFQEMKTSQRTLGVPSPGSQPIITAVKKPDISAVTSGLGRGKILQKTLSSTLPSRMVTAKSTPRSSNVETETELELSPVEKEGSTDLPRQALIEAALAKMELQEERKDASSSDETSSQPSLEQPLLSEFVEESEKQTASLSDGEVEPGEENAFPSNASDGFLAKIELAVKSGAGLLHGATDILPTNYLRYTKVDDLIFRNAKNHGVDYLTRPQYFGIPAVLTKRNIVFVGPNKSKKSSAFVIPLLSLLMNETYYSPLRKGHGPRCVFVAPTSDRVKTLGRLCSAYCGSRLTILTTYGGGLELERKNELAAGCDILITTPRCWLRLLQYPTVTNLSRLCHLVLDRFDSLADLFSQELKHISIKILDLVKIRSNKSEALRALAVQMIVSAEQWSPAVEEVTTNLLKKPVVVITSYLEATLYARIKPKITVLRADARLNKVVELVQMYSGKKIVVVCVSPNEVTEIRKACSAHCIPIVAHENMAKCLTDGVKDQWCSSKLPPLLICTDAIIHFLGITDAEALIHFSLPENKSSFSERFMVIRDHIPDRILNPEVAPPNCVVHIMFDETCEVPFPSIVDFISRISSKLPARVFDVVKAIARKKEEAKTSAPFCENILQMGSCYKKATCKSRHVIFPKLDSPKGQLKTKGLIKVQIVHVHSAVKYSARILAHNPNLRGNGNWTKYKSDFAVLSFKMGAYYSSPQNRRLHGRPKVGDLLAYQEDLDQPFFRARVIQITRRDDRQEPTEVLLLLVDEGFEIKSLTHTLIELPEDLKKYPDNAVFIYLANLKPVDLDTTWSYAAKRVVDKAIHTSEIEDIANQDIIGKILFTIGRNCVVENLTWCRRLTYDYSFTQDLRQLLLSSGCGIDNPEYSSNLAELCSSANLEIGLYHKDEKTVEKSKPKEKPRWAHLPHDEDFILVNTVIDESPSLFFIKMIRFHKNLEQLEENLSAHLNEQKNKLIDPQKGDVCAAKPPDFSEDQPIWNRCIIRSLSGEEAEIFFVDYGDKKTVAVTELYEIPWKFVVKLPFQAIECKLAGVNPPKKLQEDSSGQEWPDEAVLAFRSLIGDSTYWGQFYVKVIDLDLKAVYTGGRCYHVILLDVEKDTPVTVNQTFIEMGFGSASSINMDETDLLDAFNQIKEIDSRKKASDDDGEENWDLDLNEPGLSNKALPSKEEKASSFLDFNVDEVEISELRDFAKFLFKDVGPYNNMLKDPAPLPVDMSSSQADDIPKNVSNEPVEDGQLVQVSKECREPEEYDIPALLPWLPNSVDEDYRILVRCAPLKTPLIYWSQDLYTVTIKCMIPCLRQYKINGDLTSVTIWAVVDSGSGCDEYWKHINLFGPCYVTDVSVKLTVTCLRIKIFKRLQGYLWPRLTCVDSKEDHRIKMDPEADCFNDSHESESEQTPEDLFESYYEKGKERFASREGPRKTAEVEVCFGSSEDEVEDEEFIEPDEDADPFNPLT